MTALASLDQANKETIKSGPHWRVTIRPATFNPRLLPSPAACWDAVIERQARIRSGHSYPEVDLWREPQESADWVASDAGWSYWRYYQSGLFVHLFEFWEDREPRMAAGSDEPVANYVDPQGVVRTVSMIYAFASRLCAAGLLGSEPHIEISLNMTGHRVLLSDVGGPWFDAIHQSHEASLTRAQDPGSAELLASPLSLAGAHAKLLFRGFGWAPSDNWIRGQQGRLGLLHEGQRSS
jgi:hypothetical protein